MRQIYLCRHGETLWTKSAQHTGRTDLALTEEGKRQAALLRKRLKEISWTQIFTSPLLRARQTAEGLPAVIDSDLAEWDYGDYEGLTTAQIHKSYPHWDLFKEGAPNGESIEEVRRRADRFLKKIDSLQGNIVLFSHGHFLRILAARFLGLEAQAGQLFVIGVASLGILSFERSCRVMTLWNDTSHLKTFAKQE